MILIGRDAGVKLVELIIPSHGKVAALFLHEVVIPVKGPWVLCQVITNLRTVDFINIGIISVVLIKITIVCCVIPITLKRTGGGTHSTKWAHVSQALGKTGCRNNNEYQETACHGSPPVAANNVLII